MSDSITIDTARLPLLLGELRLPTIGKLWQSFTARADREGWPSARLLATLAELELAERAQRRIQRHLLAARLPPGKTLGSFDFASVPMISHAHVTALASGDAWLKKGVNILLFGPSGSGKSHLGAALGHALVENGYRVLFTRTTDLVQRLQTARQSLSLESAIEKLDKYHLIILDDLCYVNRDQAETSALFELIASRYERRSLLVTSNRPFGEWTTVFPDAAMTLAAVDRLVHHAVILEMNVQSYRQRSAATRQNQRPSNDGKGDTKQKETAGHPNCRAITDSEPPRWVERRRSASRSECAAPDIRLAARTGRRRPVWFQGAVERRRYCTAADPDLDDRPDATLRRIRVG
jgi:DNA replication protein DnaC